MLLVRAKNVAGLRYWYSQRALLVNAILLLIQETEEKQVRELLNHVHWISDAAGPEHVPDAVDIIFQSTSNHGAKCIGRGGR